MAAVNPTVSPPPRISQTAVNVELSASKNAASSSPGLPSPSEILMGKSSRFSHGGVAVLPSQDAKVGFVSVSSLLHASSTDDMTKPMKSEKLRSLKAKPAIQALQTTARDGKTYVKAKKGIDDLGLQQAPGRRKDWTPAKRTKAEADHLNDAETAWSTLIPYQSPVKECVDAGFGKLVQDFGYADVERLPVDRSCTSNGGNYLTKRRKLDLVTNIAITTSKPKPKGSKSPKKKPQTITDKATAPFVPEGQETTSIRSYLATHELATDIPCSDRVSTIEKASGKPETEQAPHEKPTKAIRNKTKKPKTIKQPVKLLSPESALKTTNEQDLLFGTSSQLAREESPTFVRNLQRAVRESEMVDGIESSLHEKESQTSAQSSTSNLSSSTLPTGLRNLWAIAARDSAGSLLQVDIVDLVDTPQPSRSLSTVPDATNNPVDEDRKVLEDITNSELVIPLTNNPLGNGNTIPSSVAEASLKERPRSRSPVKKSRKRKDTKIPVIDIIPPEMPDYDSLDTKELNKAAAAFGFKPMRRRGELIPLLETCWKSSNRIALQSLPPNISAMTKSSKNLEREGPDLGSVKKRRGRPPKDSSAGSDDKGTKSKGTASPKKPRGRPKKSAVADEPLQRTSEARFVSPSSLQQAPAKVSRTLAPTTSTAAAAAACDLETLLPIITKAVVTYPPTHDAKNLTWHEKMLLYDPIVLEDLSGWLNKEGLGRVGYTKEVSPVMVKQWCESQSVCCLWRENLRGGQRVRY